MIHYRISKSYLLLTKLQNKGKGLEQKPSTQPTEQTPDEVVQKTSFINTFLTVNKKHVAFPTKTWLTKMMLAP